MTTLAQKQNEYFKFNPELNPFKNNQWQKGGMTSNGLRRAGEVINHFRGPGRQNIIPDASYSKFTKSVNPAYNEPVTSFGKYQTNGLGQVAASEYGPGTLKSTNLQNHVPAVTDENSMGYMIQNEKRSQFVDYRSTDPSLVENLRNNPLSIYAVGNAKDAPVPAFFSYVRPEHYNTYKSEPEVRISKSTIEQSIDGSPQVNILGMAHQNPLMGITADIPNSDPIFNGKTYGGNDDAAAKPYADWIYDQGWTTNTLEPIVQEEFGEEKCKNKALSYFAQGYNISEQINDNKMIEWVKKGSHAVTNIPWGPVKVTGNPQTQQGGIWQRGGNPNTTIPTSVGYKNDPKSHLSGNFTVPYVNHNYYKNGLPGSIIASDGQ